MSEIHDSTNATIAARTLMRLLGAGAGKAVTLDPIYKKIAAAVDALGTAEAVLDEVEAGNLAWGQDDLFAAGSVARVRDSARAEVAEWRESARQVLALSEPGYPDRLREVADAPPFLFVEGRQDIVRSPGVAVVGSRKASDDGLKRAFKAASILSRSGLVVFSGLAKGIDSAAHRGALAGQGPTVAVMGTPIDRRYPAENAGLAEEIVSSGGALASEFVPGEPTWPWHFLRRNKTMSGLALATLVVEASETSGARSQARAALEHGRPVFLPKSLVESHDWARVMVQEGQDGVRAIMVTHPEEIAEALAGAPEVVGASSL